MAQVSEPFYIHVSVREMSAQPETARVYRGPASGVEAYFAAEIAAEARGEAHYIWANLAGHVGGYGIAVWKGPQTPGLPMLPPLLLAVSRRLAAMQDKPPVVRHNETAPQTPSRPARPGQGARWIPLVAQPLIRPTAPPPAEAPAASAAAAPPPKKAKKWDPFIKFVLSLERDSQLYELSSEALAMWAIKEALQRDADAKAAGQRPPYGLSVLCPQRPDGRPQPHLVKQLNQARKAARRTREGSA